MIKDCRVIINNKDVTVFDFDGKEVQIPAIYRDAAFIRVLYKDGKYIVVSDNYEEPVVVQEKKTKKTPKEERATFEQSEAE